ncbi:PC4-domain-containing protein, partial [Paxillus ammoniavirescens]
AKSAKEPSKPKTAKKPKFDNSDIDKVKAGEQPDVKVLKNAEGEKYVDLGKKKRAAVRSFKGQVFVDIREFYGPDGDEKPGKKGISLTFEQWGALKRSVSIIDSLLAEQGQK